MTVAAGQAHAADQVGVVFLLGEPARRRARGAPFRQNEHRTAARIGSNEGVGVYRYEQVGLHPARLVPPGDAAERNNRRRG